MFACAIRTGHWLTFRWIPSEVNFAYERSRFVDPHYDPSKCLLCHVDAQVTKCVIQEKPVKGEEESPWSSVDVLSRRLLVQGLFREPPRLERGKPETVTSASESSCLLSRKLFKVPRRAFRHEKKCCRHWKHLCKWPRSATKPFVNIPARACVRFRSNGHAFEAIGSSGGRVVEECVIPRHERRSRRHKQRLRRRAGLPTPSNSVEAPSLTTSCHDRSLDGAWTQSGTNTSGAAVSATPGTRKNYVAAIEKLSALPATGVGITFTQTRTSIVRSFFMRTSCSTPS